MVGQHMSGGGVEKQLEKDEQLFPLLKLSMDSRQKPNDKTVHTFTTIAWHSESPTISSSHAQLGLRQSSYYINA